MADISLTVVLMPIQDFVIHGGTLSSAIEPFYNADIIFFFRNKLIVKLIIYINVYFIE